MTLNEYQKLALRTCDLAHKSKEDMAHHAVFGLSSEAGEVSGIFQKEYQGHVFMVEHFKKELGDCLWMIAEAAAAYDISLEDVARTNIEKLRDRYPDGFSPERSLHRAENDI